MNLLNYVSSLFTDTGSSSSSDSEVVTDKKDDILHEWCDLTGAPVDGNALKHELIEESLHKRDFLLGSFSYYNPKFPHPWTSKDFIVKSKGKRIPWQNLMISETTMESWRYYARIWTKIYEKTGVPIIIFWKAPSWANDNDIRVFHKCYKKIRKQFPLLPKHPHGICLYDEPHPNLIFGCPGQMGIIELTQKLKSKFPKTLLYCNFLYSSIKDVSICETIGQSDLDYISSDEYYDIPLATYQETYKNNLYPYLKEHQKIFLLPFAAFYEISKPDTIIHPKTADSCCLTLSGASARSYAEWMHEDHRVQGLIVYRLKNLWWCGHGDILDNPQGTGLGLIDRRPNGEYVMKDTVKFYQKMGYHWTVNRIKSNQFV